LRRARDAAYRPSSLRELPTSWIESAFDREGRTYRLRDELRAGIEFRQEDIRTRMPEGPFDLVLCRNLVFTYFDRASQEAVLDRIVTVMRPSAALVVGRKERLPKCDTSLAPWFADLGIYRRRTPP
jgi:chemotaxis protein methyltransferase CheR